MMNIGSSLESAISTLQHKVESAKAVAAQISPQDETVDKQPSVTTNSNTDTVGQMVDVKA